MGADKDAMMDEEEVLNNEFVLVEELQNSGIQVADINKLKEAKIFTCGSVLKTPKRELLQIRGITDAKVAKLLDSCRKVTGLSEFSTGLEMLHRQKKVIHVTTGSTALDEILGGGIESGSITEFYGEYRTGKTQLMHTLCVTSQLGLEQGGGMGKVLYIDTEGNFRPQRIQQIADRFGLDAAETLDNVYVRRCHTHEEQMESVMLAQAILAEDGYFRTIIVDSVMALFRAEFLGRGQLSERQQLLSAHLRGLVMAAEEFNIAVVIINQVVRPNPNPDPDPLQVRTPNLVATPTPIMCQTANPDGMSMFGPQLKPIGGNIIAHASTTRVMLKKGRGDQRIAVVQDSPSMPEADATFRISGGGICDVE
eukprot:CAMPEP_0118854132 /NCGR_PEP_ID=MMETSP1163-20130328/2449_1 /TAXON_ID=124430 /ORGANISM="Phaeomonas parva, Strain CCMP2877" /LENGTH=365 /DNA_ID=CAMNT_0006786805 /DNA_START=266 /DNA_END=1364 /DNA_ORIENTATION=+